MRRLVLSGVAILVGSVAGMAHAASQGPPMNAFNSAYYVCSAGKDAFVVSYSGDHLNGATITTNAKGSYDLKRTPVSAGYEFASPEGVRFWTDGQRVSLTGTRQTYMDCQLH